MKKNKSANELKRMIEQIVAFVELEVEVREDRSGINMCYDFIQDYVGFDPERLLAANKEMIDPVPFEDYVKALTLHELGHFLDRKALLDSVPLAIELVKKKREIPYSERIKRIDLLQIDLEDHEMNYISEEQAWINAENLNRYYGLVSWDSFAKVRSESLLTYTAQYNRDLLIHHQLLSTEKIAV